MTTERQPQSTTTREQGEERIQGLQSHITACLVASLILFSFAIAAPPVLRLGIDAADLGTGDPHYAAQRTDRALADMVFNALLRYAPGNSPSVEPDLAVAIPDSVTVGDEQVWRFELRRGAMCHAGPKTPAYELTSLRRRPAPLPRSWS